MKKIFVLIFFVVLVSLILGIGQTSASDGHKVLIFGDSLTATNMSNWTYEIKHEYKLVAKGGQDTRWVLSQIRQLVSSGKINSFDTAVVWIGINNPELAISDIPQIYGILHAYGIKVVGVTQYLPTGGHYSAESINNILEFNEIVRTSADVVVDMAADPAFVDDNGYVRYELTVEGIHFKSRLMAEPVANVINNAIDALYAPTPTVTPTMTPVSTNTPTVTKTIVPPTATATFEPTKTLTVLAVRSGAQPDNSDKFPDTILVLIIISLVLLLLGFWLSTKHR